jgi:hypothetical protein
VVTEQIANLSARKCCLGSSPSLSAEDTFFSGCSVARLSRLLWEQEVAGSNPATPTRKMPTNLNWFVGFSFAPRAELYSSKGGSNEKA